MNDMRYRLPYIRARLLSRTRYVYPDGSFIESRIWLVPRTSRTPEGYKYSLVYIGRDGRRVLGYDNAEGKGHHKHLYGREYPVKFVSMDQLTWDFLSEVVRIRRSLDEG